MRLLLGLLVFALLAGCDREEPARESAPLPRETAPAERSGSLESPAIAPVPPQPADEPPPVEIEAVAEPEAPAKPELKVKVGPVARSTLREAPSEEPLAVPELDLSLPEDWMEALEEGEPVESQLLPPLFARPEQAPSVQVSGRLIPWVEDDETVIDGAQLDIEFRR